MLLAVTFIRLLASLSSFKTACKKSVLITNHLSHLSSFSAAVSFLLLEHLLASDALGVFIPIPENLHPYLPPAQTYHRIQWLRFMLSVLLSLYLECIAIPLFHIINIIIIIFFSHLLYSHLDVFPSLSFSSLSSGVKSDI